MRIFISLILSIVLFSSTVFSANYNSVKTGDWDQVSTWNAAGNTNNVVAGDEVHIQLGDTVTINSDLTIGNFTFFSGADAGNLIIDGVLIVNGDFVNYAGSSLIVNGTLLIDGNLENWGLLSATTAEVSEDAYVGVTGDVFSFGLGASFENEGTINAGGTITGVTGSGDAIAGHEDPLPIELTSFDVFALNGEIRVTWVTASEMDNDYFNIEKSSDGINWEVIATVAGAGFSETELTYNYTVDEDESGNYYFRLKQTDYNGEFSYSDIENIYFVTDNNETVKLHLESNQIHVVGDYNNLQVYSITGRQLAKYNGQKVLDGLPMGEVLVFVFDNHVSKKFIIPSY